MIPLKDKVNVNPPSVPYPFGELRDNPGDNTGTPVDNQLVNDVMQFMEVLMANASITPNGLPENDTNGFQLLQAFVKNVRLVYAGYAQYGVSQIANQAVTDAGTSELHHVTPKGLNDRAATETLTGISEIATQAEVDAGTDSTRFITPQKLAGTNTVLHVDGSTNLRVKVINIGDWNMFSFPSTTVSHGIASYKKIRSISATIRNDTDDIYTDIEVMQSVTISGTTFLANYGGYVTSYDSTIVTLNRKASGSFFDSQYAATSYNRGFLTITYEV